MKAISEYKIILHTWYQERGGIEDEEPLHTDEKFGHLEDAIDYLAKNKERILDEFPVWAISIRPYVKKIASSRWLRLKRIWRHCYIFLRTKQRSHWWEAEHNYYVKGFMIIGETK